MYGPNGFLRTFRGTVSRPAANLDVDCRYDVEDYELVVVIANRGAEACLVSVANAYDDDDSDARWLRPGNSFHKPWSLRPSFGWYDIVADVDVDHKFLRRLAGHVENGRDSVSDPAIGTFGHRGRLRQAVGVAKSERCFEAVAAACARECVPSSLS